MRLFSELKRAASALAPYAGQWAVCGGVAASLYRTKPRFTDDVDFALVDSPQISAKEVASKVIHSLGFTEYKGFIPNPENSEEQIFGLICARDTGSERFVGLDFLLPVQMWIEEAVRIAQSNKIDYGFSVLPTITQESLIIAKLSALHSNAERFQDLDDINEILKDSTINLDYVKERIERYGIQVSASLKKLLA